MENQTRITRATLQHVQSRGSLTNERNLSSLNFDLHSNPSVEFELQVPHSRLDTSRQLRKGEITGRADRKRVVTRHEKGEETHTNANSATKVEDKTKTRTK